MAPLQALLRFMIRGRKGRVYARSLLYDGYAVYDAAFGCFDDCTVSAEDFDDLADEFGQQLDYAGYDFGEYVGLSDLRTPGAGSCGIRRTRTRDGCVRSARLQNRLHSRRVG